MKDSHAHKSTHSHDSHGRPAAKKKEFQYAYMIEAVLLLVLMGGGTLFTLNYLKRGAPRGVHLAPKPLVHLPNVMEAEELPVLAKSRDFSFRVQDMSAFRDGIWSNNRQYFAADTRPGDWVEMALPDKAGTFRFVVLMTKSFDYGIVHFKVNGQPVGPNLDLFSGGPVVATGPVLLGNVTLKAKGNVMRIEVVGANARINPPKYFFGFDGFRLDQPISFK